MQSEEAIIAVIVVALEQVNAILFVLLLYF
jgi:hypothetical protein